MRLLFVISETREIDYYKALWTFFLPSEISVLYVPIGRPREAARSREEIANILYNQAIRVITAPEITQPYDCVVSAKFISGPSGMYLRNPVMRSFIRLVRKFFCHSSFSGRYIQYSDIKWHDIGLKVCKYPRGLDNPRVGESKFESEVDEYWAICDLDYNILKRETKSTVRKIGYPRYQLASKPTSLNSNTPSIPTDSPCRRKKTILFMVGGRLGSHTNMNNLFDSLKALSKKYTIIVRPHPRTNIHKKYLSGLIANVDKEADLNSLYLSSDYVLVSNGGSIFSSIFHKRPTAVIRSSLDDEIYRQTEQDVIKLMPQIFMNQSPSKITEQILIFIQSSEHKQMVNSYFNKVYSGLPKAEEVVKLIRRYSNVTRSGD